MFVFSSGTRSVFWLKTAGDLNEKRGAARNADETPTNSARKLKAHRIILAMTLDNQLRGVDKRDAVQLNDAQRTGDACMFQAYDQGLEEEQTNGKK